jgi:serine/threonine-protein kinase
VSGSISSSDRFPELEKFDLVEEIGHGGMATVYRARDQRLDRDVAVKVIHKHLRDNPEVRRRFVAEAKAVAKLRHPGIVEVYDVSSDHEPERYLVVELIRGKSLRQILQQYEVLPPEVAAGIVALLCDAAEHAHRTGVIHRDIKPENVLIEVPPRRESAPVATDGKGSQDGDARRKSSERPSSGAATGQRVIVKLTDFGIAKVLDAQGVTSTGQILGSPAHMAPEQIEGGAVGPATDVFALGVLMYECMVGHLPFEGKNPAQVLRRVLEGSYEPADAERAEVGGRWARILALALDIDMTQRLSSAAALGVLIEEELAALGVGDVRAEIVSFFEDPEAYREERVETLVPRLLERGERERRRGRVQDAAADFNRALALRPDDLAILKRVSTLSAQTLWRERGLRLGAIVVGSAALGGLAFGLTRWLVPDSAEGETTAQPRGTVTELQPGPQPSELLVTPDPLPSGARSARPSPSTDPASTTPDPRASASASADAGAGTTRDVLFHLKPMAATLRLDGVEHSNWFGVKHKLTVGSHPVEAFVPAGNPCCDPVSRNVDVVAAPEDNPTAVQTVSLVLRIKNASATLVNAPPGSSMSCPNGLSVASGSTGSVAMTDVDWSGSCTFSPGDKSRSVTLQAGRTVTIPWPE